MGAAMAIYTAVNIHPEQVEAVTGLVARCCPDDSDLILDALGLVES